MTGTCTRSGKREGGHGRDLGRCEEKCLLRSSIVRGQFLSSQENDETEERETGSTEPTDSVRRLGSLTGNWQVSGKN